MLSPFRMVCGDFILPESANYVSLFCFLNLRNLLYLIALFVTIRFAQNLIKLITGHDIEHEDVIADAIEAAEEAEKKGDNE